MGRLTRQSKQIRNSPRQTRYNRYRTRDCGEYRERKSLQESLRDEVGLQEVLRRSRRENRRNGRGVEEGRPVGSIIVLKLYRSNIIIAVWTRCYEAL